MTTVTMSEEQRNKATNSLWKFFSAIRPYVVQHEVFGMVASILYIMFKDSLQKKTNVHVDDDNIISMIDVPYLEVTSTNLLDKWKAEGIHNEALISYLPHDDPMAFAVVKYIRELRRADSIFIFEFCYEISKLALVPSQYLEVLDLAITLIASKTHINETHIQPKEFGDLVARMIETEGKTVFNPFSGAMSYATALEGYAHFTGIEINASICELSQFRIHMAQLEERVKCYNHDAFNWTHKQYDIIVSTPPIGMEVTYTEYAQTIRADMFCFKKFEKTATPNGEFFTFVIPSVLFDSKRASKKIRQELTEKNYLDTVIELPANLLHPYTSISLVALKLRKGRGENEPIKMIDASKFFLGEKRSCKLDVDRIIDCLNNMPSDNTVLVSTEEIRKNEYIWSFGKYFNLQTESFPEGYEVVKLDSVVDIIRGERHFSEKKGHLAMIARLANDGADCIRTVDSFEESSDLSNATKITEPVILLSSIRELKPTYCEASPENPIFIHPNLWACKLKEKWVSPTYLCLELSRRFVQVAGNVIPRITRSDILGMRVAFPSIGQQRSFEEQNNLYRQAADQLTSSRAKELGLQDYIDRLKSEYINTVRTRKHDMRPYMRDLASVSRSLRRNVEKYGSAELQEKVANLLNHFDAAYKGLSALVEVFSREEKFGTPEMLNIDKFLLDFQEKHLDGHSGFTVEYHCDNQALQEYGLPAHNFKSKELSILKGFISLKYESSAPKEIAPLFIEIAPLDLERLVNNIVENARVHGFTDGDRDDYLIEVNLTVDKEKDMYQIDFSNNGTPLPKGMDKMRYGISGEKAGKTGGTGDGGAIVKSIVEHYHGDYDVFMDGQNTVIRILLPIKDPNNE